MGAFSYLCLALPFLLTYVPLRPRRNCAFNGAWSGGEAERGDRRKAITVRHLRATASGRFERAPVPLN